VLLAACVLGACALGACGNDDPPAAAPDRPLSTVVPGYTPSPSPTAVSSSAPEDLTAFLAAVDGYCLDFNTHRREAEETHPIETHADEAPTARAVADAGRRDGKALRHLVAPPELTEDFADFMEATQEIERGDAAFAAAMRRDDPGGVAQASAVQSEALARRRSGNLGSATRHCDGRLPEAQEARAVAATEAFILTLDPEQHCGSMVTSDFLKAQWLDFPDPAAECAADVVHRRDHPSARASGIAVSDVTGVENLAATVHFSEEGCPCAGIPVVARLWFVDGEWKIHRMYYE